jgi:hypothetical protein
MSTGSTATLFEYSSGKDVEQAKVRDDDSTGVAKGGKNQGKNLKLEAEMDIRICRLDKAR